MPQEKDADPAHHHNPGVPVLLMSLLAVVVSMSIFFVVAWRDRIDMLVRAERLTADLSHILEEHALRSFEGTDLQLQRAIDIAVDTDWDLVAASRTRWERLAHLAAALPQIDAIWLVDAAGRARLSSEGFPSPRRMVGSNSFITLHSTGPPGLHFSDVIVDHRTGDVNFIMSRSIFTEDGEFRGIVLAIIDQSYFRRFYRSIGARFNPLFEIVRDDLTVLVREPAPTLDKIASLRKSDQFSAILARAKAGSVTFNGPTEGGERITTFRAIGELPLYVGVGVAREALMGQWMAQITPYALFAFSAMAALIFLSAIAYHHTLALQISHATLESRVDQRTRAMAEANQRLTESNLEKDMLIKEVHHRVRNNLQLVTSLLNLAARQHDDLPQRRVYWQSLTRIQSMGLVHEQLFQSTNISSIDFLDYLRHLAGNLRKSYGIDERRIALSVDGDTIHFDLDTAIPLALIANEIITNALSHAFPGDRAGHVFIALHRTGTLAVLEIKDDGIGSEPAVGRRTLGLRLVQSLSRQISGTYGISRNGGTRFTLVLPTEGRLASAGTPRLDPVR